MSFEFKPERAEWFVDENGFKGGRIQHPSVGDASPISVKIVKDSITDGGSRLVTWCWEYPRMIHAEIMTHRSLSRNAASSRAIPAGSLCRRTLNAPVHPFYWGKNQKGMQADQELTGDERRDAETWWFNGLRMMAEHHQNGEALGLHKQIVNRVIEPWMTIAVVVSATDHANLFHLRKHHAAEPHFQCLAGLAWELFHNNMPTYVPVGEWHLPYTEHVDVSALLDADWRRKISVGRCARVSYLTHEGKRDILEDMRLHDDLAGSAKTGNPAHASPFEHQAQAIGMRQRIKNFEGWKQYRCFLDGEAGPDTSKRCLHCGSWTERHPNGCKGATT